MSLFDDATMDKFSVEKKEIKEASDKVSVRTSLLFELLFLEKNNIAYVAKPSLEIPMLHRISKKLSRKEMYCLIWTIAHTPPQINGGTAVFYLKYIAYHVDRITVTKEYTEMLDLFDDDAIIRIEERIDGYFKSKHTE